MKEDVGMSKPKKQANKVASLVQSSVEMACSKILQFNYNYKHYLERHTM